VHRGREDEGIEGERGIRALGLGEIGEAERGEQVERDVLRDAGPHGHQHLALVVPEHGEDRRLLGHARLGRLLRRDALRLEEHGGLADGQPDEQPDEDQHRRQQERDPPAPALEGGIGLEGGEQRQNPGGQQVSRRSPCLWPGRPESAVLRLPVLGHEEHGTAPLAAEGEALDEAESDEEEGGEHPDGPERRQEADGERRATHHEQRDDQ
jgi:hypothetical protein